MKYNILTETAFFRAAQNGSLEDRTEGNGQGESDGGKGCDVHRRDAESGGADARLGDSGIGQDGAELDW